jgi:hypothetical protein
MSESEKKEEVEEPKPNCPLSPADWVTFLSDEINNWSEPFYMVGTAILTALVALGIAALAAILIWRSSHYSFLLIILMLGLGLSLAVGYYGKQRKIERLKKLRQDIVSGLKSSDKIRERWEEINEIPRKEN